MGAKLSGSGGGKFQVEANSEINVTPFVDVMLVLLIIFMVAAPLASVNVKVDLPPAVSKPAKNPPKPVFVSIKADGSTYVGDIPFPASDIGPHIKKESGRRDPTKERIFIRADTKTRYGDFMQVMNSLQDNGFYSVALVGEDKAKP